MQEELTDGIMEQAQVFASAWSLVGTRFDRGGGMEDSEHAKRELEAMVQAALDAKDAEMAALKAKLIELSNEVRPDLPEPATTVEDAIYRIRKLYVAHTLDAKTVQHRGQRIDELGVEVAALKVAAQVDRAANEILRLQVNQHSLTDEIVALQDLASRRLEQMQADRQQAMLARDAAMRDSAALALNMAGEVAALRKIISDTVTALGSGASAGEKCSLGFLQQIPDEVRETVKALRKAFETLQTPEGVRLAMLTGKIAKISMTDCAHAHGEAEVNRYRAVLAQAVQP